MPHPERTLRVANYSWAPREWERRFALAADVPQCAGVGRLSRRPATLQAGTLHEKGLVRRPGLLFCRLRSQRNLNIAVFTLPSLSVTFSCRQPTQLLSVFHT